MKQIDLYDVHNPINPTRVDMVVIGDHYHLTRMDGDIQNK